MKDSEADKVEALDLGADDDIAKPFGMSELLARVHVSLRRIAKAKSGTEPRVQMGPLLVDFAQRRVVLRGREGSMAYGHGIYTFTGNAPLNTRHTIVSHV